MAVSIVGTPTRVARSVDQITPATTFNFNVVVGAGTERVLLQYSGPTSNLVGTPLFDGVATTAVSGSAITYGIGIAGAAWYIDFSTAGTFVAGLTNTVNTNQGVWTVTCLAGVDLGQAPVGSTLGLATATAISPAATVGADDIGVISAVGYAGGGSATSGTTAIGSTLVSAQGAAQRGMAGYRLAAAPSLDFTSGQLCASTVVVKGATGGGGGDVTAPTLTSPTGTGGASVCSGGVTTDEGNGTLYAVATASATAPTAAQVKLGQDHTGAAALRVVSQAVSATGAQTVASGAVSAGTRYLHYMHEDAATNQSAVVSSASFVVTAAGATLTSSALKNNTGTLLTSAAAEAYVSNPSTGALVLKKTGLTSHATTGVITFSDAALSAATSYRVVWRLTATGAEGLETLTAA